MFDYRVDLAGRPVLVTGASSGIGRHVARTLRGRGYRVFPTARKWEDVEELAARGFEAFRLDYADPESIRGTVEGVMAATGGLLYGLVNNGAYGQPGAVEDLSREALTAQFEANFFGWVELTNLVLPAMRQQGNGRIVMISSILGLVGLPYRGAYVASKFAVEGITDCLRLELAGSGVQVSLVEPGPIRSRFREHAIAAFDRWIDAEGSVHRERYARWREKQSPDAPDTPFALGPDAVTKRVIHALEADRARVRYYVTFPTHLFGTLKRLLPFRLLDRMSNSRRVSG